MLSKRPTVLASMPVFLLLATGGSAMAEPLATVKFKYYLISGKTAESIHDAMMRKGPNVGGSDAYAITEASAEQLGDMYQAKGQCQIRNYRIKVDFVVRLPKLTTESALSGVTRANWAKFKEFTKTHELHHTKIWTDCAREQERRVLALRIPTCSAFEKKASALWAKMRKSCEAKHDAFDAAEKSRVLKQPFIRQALGLSGKTVAAKVSSIPAQIGPPSTDTAGLSVQ